MVIQRTSRRKTRSVKIAWWLWLKAYFDTGYGLTSYAKAIFPLLGFISLGKGININYVVYLGIAYVLVCPIIGWAWIHFKIKEAENEINNVLNPFQREVRKSLNIRSQ